MASAFGGSFTALYVQTPAFEKMEEADRNRLEQNIRLAKQLGADTTTIFGEMCPSRLPSSPVSPG